uniref:F-box/FBD/LRR-repeat protein n=1 Tax=Steinernema glaseri TaxID=37863 RepID=A0A1I8AA24_9BILA
MTGTLRIDPANNRLYVKSVLTEEKTTLEVLRTLPHTFRTLVIQAEKVDKKGCLHSLKKRLKRTQEPINIHELFFLPACKSIEEIRVLDSYSDLDAILKHPIVINSTFSFTFIDFTAKVCDFLIVHKRVKYLSIGEVSAPGLATVIKSNPSLEYLVVKSTLLPVDILSFVELLFATKHNPCVIDCQRCMNSREISRFLRRRRFKMETFFDSDDYTIIRVTHSKYIGYCVEIAFRSTLTIASLQTAEVI